MRQFMMTVIALTAFGAVVVTAQAENGGGAPVRNGDQCFGYSDIRSGGMREGRFGYWHACPQPQIARPSQTVGSAATCTQLKADASQGSSSTPTLDSRNPFVTRLGNNA
jgi:hypothetical protein